MRDFWLVDNREFAEMMALSRVKNYLADANFYGRTPTPSELLEFIKRAVDENTADLDLKYPNRKAFEPC